MKLTSCWMMLACCLALVMAVPTQAMRDPGFSGNHGGVGGVGFYGGAGAAPVPVPGQGYHDGMNLYGGYFAMRGVLDPSGLAVEGKTVEIVVEPDQIEKVGWSNAGLSLATFGATMLFIKNDDELRPFVCACDEETDKWTVVWDEFDVQLAILIDSRQLRATGRSVIEIFGHEQRHVLNYYRYFDDQEQHWSLMLQTDPLTAEDECRVRALQYSNVFIIDLLRHQARDRDHKLGEPVAGLGYAPIGGYMPNSENVNPVFLPDIAARGWTHIGAGSFGRTLPGLPPFNPHEQVPDEN